MNEQKLHEIIDRAFERYEFKKMFKAELLKAINESKKFVTVGKGKSAHPIPVEWLQKKEGFLSYKKAAAWDILSQATGKNKKWLKMQYRKSNEFILNLLEKTDDKLELGYLDGSIFEIYPELHQLDYENSGNETIGIGYEIAHRVYQDLLDDNFYDVDILERENEQAEYELEENIKQIKSKINTSFAKGLVTKGKITEDTLFKMLEEIDKHSNEETIQALMDDYNLLGELFDLQKYL